MGQSHSDDSSALDLGLGLPVSVESVQDDIFRQARFLTEIGSLSYEEFQAQLLRLNQLSTKCVDKEGNQLIFAVKSGSDKTLLWKGTVKIACVRRNFLTKNIVSFRLLTLSQFLKVFQTLQSQFLAAEQSRDHLTIDESNSPSYGGLMAQASSASGSASQDLTTDSSSNATGPSSLPLMEVTASMLLDELDYAASEAQSQERLGECCICLERKPEVLLPCTHSYCLPCIEQWNVNHKTCPICRETLESTDDTWVISEAPGAEEICGSLMELSKSTPLRHD